MPPDTAFFLHIPRTAGTTLNSVLTANYAPEEVLSVYDKDDYKAHRAHSPAELAKIRLIQGHLLLPRFDPPGIYGLDVRVFTFVREPVSRLVSEYLFLKSWKANHLYAYLHEQSVSFRRYIESDDKRLRYRGKNFMTRCISGLSTGDRAYPARAVARAKQHLEKVFGFVGIQERFPESLLLLGDFLPLRTLFHERRNTLEGQAREEISREDLDVARERNQGDAEVYAFACGLFSERVAAAGPGFAERVRRFLFLNDKYRKMSALLMRSTAARDTGPIGLPKESLWR
ncbi:MAG: sulfotransferase family protein [Desulfovibrio sp.]|jgi:hypothetical protein|nr:sulfotransferase family protein [Desulfovibrio sp.]